MATVTKQGDLFMKNQANEIAKECMATALMQLLEKKSISDISISELAEKAGVSRMTFYRNYNSKEDIFTTFLHDIIEDYHKESTGSPLSTHFYDLENLTRCFTYFEEYKTFIGILFRNGMGNLLLDAIREYIIHKWFHCDDSIEYYYTLQAFTGSLINLLIAWGLEGRNETPEEMAYILNQIFRK